MQEGKPNYRLTSRRGHPKGVILKIGVGDRGAKVLLTHHSLDRIAFWGLSEEQVLESLLYPEEVLIGHCGRYIAHKLCGRHIIRAVYEYQGNIAVLVTVYRPLAARYFEGEGRYEDKILT